LWAMERLKEGGIITALTFLNGYCEMCIFPLFWQGFRRVA